MSGMKKFIDIGANLTDLMYSGFYNGSSKHIADLQQVLKRSWESGLEKVIITGGNLEESKKALEIAKTDDRLYTTVGCHPTRCSEFEENPDRYLEDLKKVIEDGAGKVVAIGECGLDYDRLQFCPKDTQMKYFQMQLSLSTLYNLPLFLHCRNAADDLTAILKTHSNLRGVVHSFDGTIEEAQRFVDMDFYIGINGCSLKTKDNLKTVELLPKDRILLETDCPWCEIRPSHAGYSLIAKSNQCESAKKEKWDAGKMVKSRNEPANIRQVYDVVRTIKNEDLAEQFYENTVNLFFSKTNI